MNRFTFRRGFAVTVATEVVPPLMVTVIAAGHGLRGVRAASRAGVEAVGERADARAAAVEAAGLREVGLLQ